MCFLKTKQSKVLKAKRDIQVYKIGTHANNSSFIPFYYNDFEYPTTQIMSEIVAFDGIIENGLAIIEKGLHSYLNCVLYPLYPRDIDLYTLGDYRYTLSFSLYSLFLGKFIIPKGATYCLNNNGEVVSDRLMYTGNYIELQPNTKYDTKKLWKEE